MGESKQKQLSKALQKVQRLQGELGGQSALAEKYAKRFKPAMMKGERGEDIKQVAEYEVAKVEKQLSKEERAFRAERFKQAHPRAAAIQASVKKRFYSVPAASDYRKGRGIAAGIAKIGRRFAPGAAAGRRTVVRAASSRRITPEYLAYIRRQGNFVPQRQMPMPQQVPQEVNAGNFGYKPTFNPEQYNPEESHGGFLIPSNKLPQQPQDRGNIIQGEPYNPNPFFKSSINIQERQIQPVQTSQVEERDPFFANPSKNKIKLI